MAPAGASVGPVCSLRHVRATSRNSRRRHGHSLSHAAVQRELQESHAALEGLEDPGAGTEWEHILWYTAGCSAVFFERPPHVHSGCSCRCGSCLGWGVLKPLEFQAISLQMPECLDSLWARRRTAYCWSSLRRTFVQKAVQTQLLCSLVAPSSLQASGWRKFQQNKHD